MIIGVGYPKTGSVTLAHALRILGVSTKHFGGTRLDSYRKMKSHLHRAYPYLKENYPEIEGFIDFPFFKHYPEIIKSATGGVKVICTYRDPAEISLSYQRMIRRRNEITPRSLDASEETFSSMIDRAVEHYDRVFQYFNHDRPDIPFLVLRICDGDGWEPLCEFLGKDIPKEEFPWEHQH